VRRVAILAALALAGFVVAVAVFNTPGRKGCPLKADRSGAYAGKFVGEVSTAETSHDLVITRDGKPLTGVEVCVNTEMVGMTGMGYSATARELSPGHFAVPFRFEMAGDYRTNIVAKDIDGEFGMPLTVKVSGAMNMGDGG